MIKRQKTNLRRQYSNIKKNHESFAFFSTIIEGTYFYPSNLETPRYNQFDNLRNSSNEAKKTV